MGEEMRIAILSTFPDKKCGIADYIYPVVQELKKSDELEKLIVIGDLESTKADYMVDFKSFKLYKLVNEIIAKESIDLLYIEHEYWIYGKTNLGFIGVHKKLDIPIVTNFTAISSNDPGISLLERIRAKIVEGIVSTRAKKIVVSYGADEEQLADLPTQKIAKIPLGIAPISKLEKRKKEGDKKTILFFGIISSHKGVENLIKSSKYLKDVRIAIAGRPNMDFKELLMLKEEYLKYNEIILDFEWIPDDKKNEYFSKADVVVLPYTRIGIQSGVLYDALGYGVPCVVSSGGMMGAVVNEYSLGAVVDPMDPEDIARGITKVLNGYSKYKDNVLKYQKTASWENVAKMYVGLFKEVLV
ncbi:glycosyltransferase [Halobacteriota archaeon]